jgi:hypothetical protein
MQGHGVHSPGPLVFTGQMAATGEMTPLEVIMDNAQLVFHEKMKRRDLVAGHDPRYVPE